MDRRQGFLQQLSPAERASLDPFVQAHPVRRGEALFLQGQEPEHLFYIHQGCAKVEHCAPNGRSAIVELLFPGDLCGGLCALDRRPYPVGARFLVDGSAARIPSQDFLALAARHPGLLSAALRSCLRKVRQGRRLMVALAVERAEQRAAWVLLLLAGHLGVRASGGVRLPMVLDRRDFADFIGVTPETASRILTGFRHQGLLSQRGQQVLLRDEHRLRAMTGPEEQQDLASLPPCSRVCAVCRFAEDCAP
ncbi:MAG TPA: Crp/Fnr family transcriptional regulator [Candidatus Nitrosotenuis sp.]|nr:Crp/Fnr family transcriptional regulator [Candidatus Nitrosotenuis sp.]